MNIKKLEVNSSVTAVSFYQSRGYEVVEELSYPIACGIEDEHYAEDGNEGELIAAYIASLTKPTEIRIECVLMEKQV